MTTFSITAPNAAEAWLLTGPVGQDLDVLVVTLLQAGVKVEHIGEACYRLTGDVDTVTACANQLERLPGFAIAVEMPPAEGVSLAIETTPPFPYVRATVVHTSRYSVVARAVDRGLKATPVGIGRFRVTGRTSTQVAWLSAALDATRDAVLAMFAISAEDVRREDDQAANRLLVSVSLPTRQSETIVTARDPDGAIAATRTVETTLEVTT